MTPRPCRLHLALVPLLAAVSSGACGEAPPTGPHGPRVSPRVGHESGPWAMYADPADAGFDAARLEQAREHAVHIRSAAVMVVADGAVVAEWGDIDRRFSCHSIRKSLLGTLYGTRSIDVTATLGALGIDDAPFPLTPAEKGATIADLMATRSGIYIPSAYSDVEEDLTRPPRGAHPPGTFFFYNNWGFNALVTIYERQTGGRVFEDFDERVARPLGMERYRPRDGYYHYQRERSMHPAYPFKMATRDLARVGRMYAESWHHPSFVPPEWIAWSTTPVSRFRDGEGYGHLWWTWEKGVSFEARGWGGHVMRVLPAEGLVLVHRADTWDDARVPFGSVDDLFERILDARTGTFAASPRLVPLREAVEPIPAPVAGDMLERCLGRYRVPAETSTPAVDVAVVRYGDTLVLDIPIWGRFDLIPRAPFTFEVDDLEWHAMFQPGPGGEIASLRADRLIARRLADGEP